MKKRIGLAFALVLLLTGASPLIGQQSFLLKNHIVVEKDDVQENVITFGGDILIKGRVKQNAVAFGGTIVVEGEVGEVVLGFGADITLRSTARVRGDVVSLGGILEKEPGTVIDGDTVYFESTGDLGRIFGQGLFGQAGFTLIPFLIVLKIVMAFIWFLLALLLVVIMPRQVALASDQIRKSFWPVFGIGAIGVIVFIALVIFAAFLSLALIGLPILAALAVLGIVIKVFGQVVLFYFFGESLTRALGKKKPSPLVYVVAGFLLVTLIGVIPLAGPLFSFILSLIGMGVVIRTKFGTTTNWLSRKSAAP